MKKQLIIIAIFMIFFISCTGFFEMRDEVQIVGLSLDGSDDGEVITKTNVIFNNTNRFPVDVFSDGTRTVRLNRNVISAYGSSGYISWLPTRDDDGFIFYLTFYLPIDDIAEIPFIPSGKWGYTMSHIPFEKTTPIPIPSLADIPSGTRLIDDVAVIVENNVTSTIRLERGGSAMQPQNITGTTYVNSGQKGFYRINPTNNANGYGIRIGAEQPIPLPSDITSLTAGYIYVIEVQSNGTLRVKKQEILSIDSF